VRQRGCAGRVTDVERGDSVGAQRGEDLAHLVLGLSPRPYRLGTAPWTRASSIGQEPHTTRVSATRSADTVSPPVSSCAASASVIWSTGT
jgi:hypothetical protein